MYLRWSARVAQFLFNQACQFSPFWLYATTVSSSHKPVALQEDVFLLFILIVTYSTRES